MTEDQLDTALWYFGRGTGIAALVLLSVGMVAGLLTRRRARIGDLPQFALTEIHRRATLVASGLILLHLGSLFFDAQAQVRAVDLVVPFLASWSPLWLGLGTLALDVLVVVVLTSMLRRRMPYAVWRRLHLAAYLLWPIAVAHALGTGTDNGTWWALCVTIMCVVAVVGVGAWSIGTPRSGAVAQPAPAVPASTSWST